jgi:putative thioredoxin
VATDVTDATFQSAVIERSNERPVIVDLWAPWCGPCRTLGPLIESVVDATGGRVELVKVNVDENPQISRAFGVQSIPAVFALAEGKVVDSFIGAVPEPQIKAFVDRLLPASAADRLAEAGDEASLRRALELEPGHSAASAALARILAERGETEQALALIEGLPASDETRHVEAIARLSANGALPATDDALDARLDALLEVAKDDEAARKEFLDLLEAMEPDDDRRARYRRALASRLF